MIGAMIRTAHTHELDAATMAAARALLDAAFPGEMTDEDWDHGLGGIHALAYADGELVGHASVVQRRLLHGGRALRAGYVEAVAVRADQRRRGHGGALMAALEAVVHGAYEIGALGASEDGAGLYSARGWRRWAGELYALTPEGVRRTPAEEGDVFVLEAGVPLDLAGRLTCDWRDGDLW
jgi:aminoglycoside 2'-N-acetyltransferase I